MDTPLDKLIPQVDALGYLRTANHLREQNTRLEAALRDLCAAIDTRPIEVGNDALTFLRKRSAIVRAVLPERRTGRSRRRL